MDYNYENLDPERFQEFCQALLNIELPNISVFPVGQPDGGRDAIQRGNSKGGGFIIFQIKFIRKNDGKSDIYKWLQGILKAESPKIERLVTKGASAFHLITNHNGTGHLETGTIDKVNGLLKKYIQIPAYCWWREDINSKLHGKLDLKRAFPELLTPADLYGLISENSIQNTLDFLKKVTTSREEDVVEFLNIDNIPYEEDKDFTGREVLIQEIITVLKSNKTLQIKSFIFGLGGVGKTALAIQAVHEIKRQGIFPDGIIWYRVRDEDFDKVICRFSMLICRAAKIKNEIIELPTISEKIEFFKNEFRKYRLLFVLDNADNNLDSLIRPLLDALSGFSVILTSRQELTLPSSSHIINLGGLKSVDAVALFKKVIGVKYKEYGSDNDILEICRLIGFLPLAVKLASMYIIEKRIIFSSYIKKWKQGNERLKLLRVNSTEVDESRRNISTCFELSLTELNDKEKEIFLFMTLFQSNFDIAALINLLPNSFFDDVGIKSAYGDSNKYEFVEEILNGLKRLSLIDRLEGFGSDTRIYLHPLIIEFGSEKRSAAVSESTSRIHEYYLGQVKDEIPFNRSDYQNLKKAVEWKFNTGDHKLFIELVRNIKGQLQSRGLWKLKKYVLELGCKASQFMGDRENFASLLGWLGDLRIRQNDYAGYSEIKIAIDIFENELTVNHIKNNSRISSDYNFFKYLLCNEPGIDYLTKLDRACNGINIAIHQKLKGADVSQFNSAFRTIYNFIGDFLQARRLAHFSVKEERFSLSENRKTSYFNLALAYLGWVDNITSNKHYLKNLEAVTSKLLQIGNNENEIDTLIVSIIPCQIRYLIYRNEFENASLILEQYRKYFELSDNENILRNYFKYSSRIHEFQGDYVTALSLIEKANNINDYYALKISYLAILCDDQLKANDYLNRFSRNWSFESVIGRLLFYGVSFLFSTKYEKKNIKKYAGLYFAYQSELKYERIALDYKEIFTKINDHSLEKINIDELKNKIFSTKVSPELIVNMNITYEPHKKILLPKTYDIVPISLGELMEYCKINNLELPLYYQLNEPKNKLQQPARFINGHLAKKIASKYGNVLPAKNDVEVLQIVSGNTIIAPATYRPIIPNAEDWNALYKIVWEWCKLKNDKFNIVTNLIKCLNLSIEDRFKLLHSIKVKGIENFSRAIYYRISGSGTQGDLEFNRSNPHFHLNQWRVANTLLCLLGEKDLPEISTSWGLDIHENREAYYLLPLVSGGIIEASHPEMSYADCVILLTKRIDDYLYKDQGQF